MNFYKKNNITFIFTFFLCMIKAFAQGNDDKIKQFLQERINIVHKIKDDKCEDPIEKDISLVEENNKLKIQIEVYNIYLYFLIILNIIFVIALFIFLICKIYSKVKEINIEENMEKELLLNEIDSKKNEGKNEGEQEENNKQKENTFTNEDLLNNSGCEAPPIQTI